MNRLFEYLDDDGHTFWSFYRHNAMTVPATRLVMRDRTGVPVSTFMAQLRSMAGDDSVVASYDYGRTRIASAPPRLE